MQKVALLSTRGLPARYGAFEQTVYKLVEANVHSEQPLHYFVGTDLSLRDEEFDADYCTRAYSPRASGAGVILYGLLTTLACCFRGCKTFVYFGYTMAPIFPILTLFGYKVICNVDGFEWRRAKWGRLAKSYFRFCEKICGISSAYLVSDAETIRRYYSIKHSKLSTLIRYGAEPYCSNGQNVGDYFVVVMRMEPENNIKMIVEGFSQSKSSKKLHLIGPSTLYFETEIMHLIDKDPRIVYRGPIYDRAELIRERADAFAYIHGHSVGGTNPTLVEACYIGLPVISYNTCFNREVLKANGTYFRNKDQLTEVIDRSDDLKTPPVLNDDYNWSSIAEKYRRLIDG